MDKDIKYNALSQDIYYNITNSWNYIPDEILKIWKKELRTIYYNDIEKMAIEYNKNNIILNKIYII